MLSLLIPAKVFNIMDVVVDDTRDADVVVVDTPVFNIVLNC